MALSDLLLKGKAKEVVDEDLDTIFRTSAGPSTAKTQDSSREKAKLERSRKRKSIDHDGANATVLESSRKKSRRAADAGDTAGEDGLQKEHDAVSSSRQDENSEPNASDDEENDDGELPVHESLSKESRKRVKTTSNHKLKYVPEDETKERRDRRSVFIGNVPAEVAKSRPLLKKLKKHILVHVPQAAIESIRLRSIAFKVPTAPLEDEDEKMTKHREQSRAAKWREEHQSGKVSEKQDEKVYLTPKSKRKLAFIKGDVHEKSSSIHAYVVFAHPIPTNLRPKNVPQRQSMDPFEAAQISVEQCDGTTFLDHTLRVDFVNQSAAPPQENAASTGALTDPRLSIFVGNLDFASSEEDLRAFFDALVCAERGAPEAANDGPSGRHKTWVTRVRVVRDRETQVGKGFAYVQFADRDCVDEILALEQDKLKFAKRKLRVQRCKTLPSAGDNHDRNTRKQPSHTSQGPKPRASTSAFSPSSSALPHQAHGDPHLGEKLAGLSKEMRKQIKATNADRVARRLAKKKARAALEKGGVTANTKERVRDRKSATVAGKVLNKGRKAGKTRVRSDMAVARKNVKKQ